MVTSDLCLPWRDTGAGENVLICRFCQNHPNSPVDPGLLCSLRTTQALPVCLKYAKSSISTKTATALQSYFIMYRYNTALTWRTICFDLMIKIERHVITLSFDNMVPVANKKDRWNMIFFSFSNFKVVATPSTWRRRRGGGPVSLSPQFVLTSLTFERWCPGS